MSSSASSTTTIPFPSMTPFPRVARISNTLERNQVVAMHGKDKLNSPTPADIFSFWVCTVEDKKEFVPAASHDNNEQQQRQNFSDSFLNCSGTDSEKGDIKFWMLEDYDKKYQVRPASERDVNEYVAEGQKLYGIKYQRKSIPSFLMMPRQIDDAADAKNRHSRKSTSAFDDDFYAMSQEQQDRIDLLRASGIHPFHNKHEEREYGVYGVRIVREYSNKAKALLAKLLKEIGNDKGLSGN